MKRICVNCFKHIGQREHYFEVIEWKDKKCIGIKYAHKTCQDEYSKNLKESMITPEMRENLSSALKKANNLLTEMGGVEVIRI